jgi:integrase
MPRRRGNNEGTISKRADGRWEARLTFGDGKRKCFYGKTRQEVARRLAEAQHEIEQGMPLPDERQTVQQYLETWIETVKLQIRPGTWRRYHDFVSLHLIPALGKTALVKLSPQQIQLLYTKKFHEGLSTTTIHHLHGMLHRALKDAMRMGMVARNVTEMVTPPRRAHKEMMTLTEEQCKVFLEAVTGDRFEALYVLALTTGMRIGELLAIRWADIDVEQATLQVRASLQEVENKFVIAETKTAYSRRRIGLSQVAVEALRGHRVRQHQERLALGPVWNTALDLVFPNAIGGIMIPDNLTKRSFKRHLAQAGLPQIRFHDLRHTAATVLLARGINPKVVSEMLGHADIAITLRVYAHVTPHMQAAAASMMDVVFKHAVGK